MVSAQKNRFIESMRRFFCTPNIYMFKPMGKKIFTILCIKSLFISGPMVRIPYAQKPPSNAYAGINRGARGLNFDLSLHLQ